MLAIEPFPIYADQMVDPCRPFPKGGNRATRDLCCAYLTSGARLFAQGKIELAVEHLEEAVCLARTNDDPSAEGAGLGCLGNVYYYWQDMEQALSCYQSALRIARAYGGRQGKGYILFNLSLVLYESQDSAQAQIQATAALQILEQTADPGIVRVRAQLEQWQAETR